MANDQNTKFRGGGVNINYSVANSGNFPTTQILREVILKPHKLPFLFFRVIAALNFELLVIFDIFNCVKFPKY